MKQNYRVTASDENGEVYVNELVGSLERATNLWDKLVGEGVAKEIVIAKVFFDDKGVWIENLDEQVKIWNEV